MQYFVSADIHGFFDAWMKAFTQKGFDINDPNHKSILCGDIFDRGRQPKQIIDFVLSHTDKIILIRGNHEDLMEDMIARNINTTGDLHNGTAQTIVDLCPEWLITENNLAKIAKETGLQKVLDMCIDYFETEHYIFVHGWIPTIENCMYDVHWRAANTAKWKSARWTSSVDMYELAIYDPDKTIVCGHWHCSAHWHAFNPQKYDEFGIKANFNPFITDKMIALDTCTVYTKKVNVIVLEE